MARSKKKATDNRLPNRIDDWTMISGKEYLETQGLKMHKPGSQNRKK